MGVEEINACGEEVWGLTVVNRENVERTAPRAPQGSRSFYIGSEPTWRDILDEVPARLGFLDDLIECIKEGSARRVLLNGPAGSGKTTILMQSALGLAELYPHHLMLWINNAAPFPIKLLSAVIQSREAAPRVILFVDNASQYADAIGSFFATHGSNRYSPTLVCSDRSNATSRRLERVTEFDRVISTRRINTEDAARILQKLEQFGAWGVLQKLSEQERMKALLDKAEKQLLIGLREATAGIGYDRIIVDEYKRVDGKDARAELLLVSLATMHHVPLSVSTLDGAMKRLGCALPVPVDQGVEDIAILDAAATSIRLRHAIIADFIVMKAIDRSEAIRGIKALLASLGRLEMGRTGAKGRSRARGPESKLYVALINHENIWRIASHEHLAGQEIYRSAEEYFREDALFWLHYALYEQKCGKDHIDDAINHIRYAMGIYPGSYEISNAYANIHFNAAEIADSAQDALVLMDGATETMEKQTRDPKTEPYAIVGLVEGRLKVLSRWYPERCERERLSLLNRLKTARKRHPSNREIERALKEAPLIGKVRPRKR